MKPVLLSLLLSSISIPALADQAPPPPLSDLGDVIRHLPQILSHIKPDRDSAQRAAAVCESAGAAVSALIDPDRIGLSCATSAGAVDVLVGDGGLVLILRSAHHSTPDYNVRNWREPLTF